LFLAPTSPRSNKAILLVFLSNYLFLNTYISVQTKQHTHMKNLLTLCFCSFVALSVWANTPPKPPIVSPASSFLTYGQSATLTALGCAGSVTWSNGQTGNSVNITPKEDLKLTATCTVASETSIASNVAVVTINWVNSCDTTQNLTAPLSNTARKYEAKKHITATNSVASDASVRYNAGQSVTLNPGFQTNSGAVFKSHIEGCSNLSTRQVATGLSSPWEILWGPDSFIWNTERRGIINRINPTTGSITQLLDLTSQVSALGESGLLGMVLHPDFTTNPYVYVVFTYHVGGPQPSTAGMLQKVVRYSYTAPSTLNNAAVILDNIPANSQFNNHFGSRLVITPDLKLFVSTGDIANAPLSQNRASLNGKILRMNLDGSIPADNPTANSLVWTSGHRNPQGLVYANGNLYSAEHGPNTDDEVNLILKNRNYGWPNVFGHCDGNLGAGEATFCVDSNVVQPLVSWFPSNPFTTTSTIAPSGMDYYNNNAIPQWKNSLLVAILKNQRLMQLKLDETGTYVVEMRDYFINQFGRIRDICVNPAGQVFVCIDAGGGSGKVIEITPTP
jgi:aldose sugar dehydrogenase